MTLLSNHDKPRSVLVQLDNATQPRNPIRRISYRLAQTPQTTKRGDMQEMSATCLGCADDVPKFSTLHWRPVHHPFALDLTLHSTAVGFGRHRTVWFQPQRQAVDKPADCSEPQTAQTRRKVPKDNRPSYEFKIDGERTNGRSWLGYIKKE